MRDTGSKVNLKAKIYPVARVKLVHLMGAARGSYYDIFVCSQMLEIGDDHMLSGKPAKRLFRY